MPAPTLLFVVLGVALGPSGLNILTRAVLARGQAIPWVALAVLGIFVGLGLARASGTVAGKTFLGSGVLALITVGTVAVGLFVLVSEPQMQPSGNLMAASILMGVCASASAALSATGGAGGELQRAAHLADLDDVPLVLFGTMAVAALAGDAFALRLFATVAGGGR